MATAKKLPSGSWRIRAFDYTDTDGKKHYRSFTCDDPSAKGKRKCELMAAEWAAEKETGMHYIATMSGQLRVVKRKRALSSHYTGLQANVFIFFIDKRY